MIVHEENIDWTRYLLSMEIIILDKTSSKIESNTKTIGYHAGNILIICKAEDYMDLYLN